jgi:hypothetical protein
LTKHFLCKKFHQLIQQQKIIFLKISPSWNSGLVVGCFINSAAFASHDLTNFYNYLMVPAAARFNLYKNMFMLQYTSAVSHDLMFVAVLEPCILGLCVCCSTHCAPWGLFHKFFYRSNQFCSTINCCLCYCQLLFTGFNKHASFLFLYNWVFL